MKTESNKKNQKIKEKIFDIFFHACLQEFKVDELSFIALLAVFCIAVRKWTHEQ